MDKDNDGAMRRDERYRIAQLIDDHATTIAEFAADKERAVLLTALVLRLGELPPCVEAFAEASS